MRPFPGFTLLFAAALLAAPHPAVSARYTVGAGAACSHTDIEAALESARTNPGPDTVVITRSVAWHDLDLTTDVTEDLTVTGGLAGCDVAFSDQTRTELRGDTSSGADGDREPVLRIHIKTPARVRLHLLSITQGDQDGDGGGIHLSGDGTLELSESAIFNNTADYGGGIYLSYDGSTFDSLRLVIGANVAINGNTARYSGGGIFMSGYSRLTMTAPGSVIALNKALGQLGTLGVEGGYGGGLRMFGPRNFADIGTNGSGTLGAIYGNEARHGGGIAINNDGVSQLDTGVRIFTTDPAQPTSIRANFASVSGGGIYVEPYDEEAGDPAPAFVQIHDANLVDNASPSGAAIRLSSNSDASGDTEGAKLFVNDGARPAGARGCDPGLKCTLFARNRNVDANNAPTGGATIHAADDTSALIRFAVFEDNAGGNLVFGNSAGDGPGIAIEDSLIDHNVVTGSLVRTNGGPGDAPLAVRRTTIAGNTIGGPAVFELEDSLTLEGSIVHQPAEVVVSGVSGRARDIEDVLANEVASMPTGQRLHVANPRFMDEARRDYRLRAASPAVDYGPTQAGPDLDGATRGRDLGLVQNRFGASDLGAYERQAIGNLIHNPNFAGDAHQWNLNFPNQFSYSTQNAIGEGTGSIRIHQSNAPVRLIVPLAQCVHLPGPGTYALSAWGLSPGFTRFDHDRVALFWDRRRAGTEDCNAGPDDGAGELFVTASGVWTQSMPFVFTVTPAEWTPTSSMTVALAVEDTGNVSPVSIDGYVDGVSLVPADPPVLLIDGFEDL